MTMIPEIRKCPNCNKRYAWNPDVGKIKCPKCRYTEFQIEKTNLFEPFTEK